MSTPSRPFEETLSELESLVRSLESGKLSLEEAIEAYARGTDLRQQCQKTLDAARLKVEAITKTADGEITLTPLDTTHG